MLLSARTFDELHDRLPEVNTRVPARPAPRGTTPEIYSIVRLLGSMPFVPEDFPLELVKGERPDFALQLGVRSIGIEHTEAIPENVAHESTLRAAVGQDTYLMRNAVVGEPRKSRKQLLAEIEEDRMPPPMMGDSVERGWAEAIAQFIDSKVASAKKPGYAAHDEHWLVIYDNWPAPASSASWRCRFCRSVCKSAHHSTPSQESLSWTSACWSTWAAIAHSCTA